MFPNAPEPFIDLSTGINPYPYPLPPLPAEIFSHLPDRANVRRLATIAAQCYGAPSADHVVPAPGTQILLPQVVALVRPGRAAILRTTYAEHARAASLAGHCVSDVADADQLRGADLAIVVNPNNPDGRIVPRAALLAISDALRTRGLFSSSTNRLPTWCLTAQALAAKPSAETLSCCDRSENSSGLRVCASASRWPRQPLQTNSTVARPLGRCRSGYPGRGERTGGRDLAAADACSLTEAANGSTSSSPGQVLKTSAAHRFTGSLDPPARRTIQSSRTRGHSGPALCGEFDLAAMGASSSEADWQRLSTALDGRR